jgi:DNA-binding protein WhiA
MIADIIDRYGIMAPCITERKDAVGLFYRNESAIEDMLTACGASKALFTFFDVAVEKNLRNTENRATNCVAKNISKSVTAAAMQISAIEALISNGMFDELPEELKKTAMLRLDNPDVSLTELMTLHVPAISKSGLNHRLARLIEEARKKGLI